MIINRKKGAAGLYLHIPFCLRKCVYCDFLSFGGRRQGEMRQYAEALSEELRLRSAPRREVDTIFIGGGTPSLLETDSLQGILKAAKAAFCVEESAEISLEANPGTLDGKKLKAYRRMGINRLSIGAQSMDDGLLRFLGRAHDRKTFLDSFHEARTAGFENLNVDLMFGIPGQTMEVWKDTLAQVMELAPEHISFYGLQLEEGTPLCRQYKREEIDLPPRELERAMYHEGIRMLKQAGYAHYEISNCAKPGYECRHNQKYWNFEEYLAAGLSAHSFQYETGRRRNVSDLDAYFQAIREGRLPEDAAACEEETLRDYMGEYAFTALRKAEGLDTADFERTFGVAFTEVYGALAPLLARYEKEGLLKQQDGRLMLTEKGIDCSNSIMAEFV